MRRDAPIELDDDLVDMILDMSQLRFVKEWNDALDALAKRPKVWRKVEQALKIYKQSRIRPDTRIYPVTREGWHDLLTTYGFEKASELLADAHSDVFDVNDWFMLVISGKLVSYDQDSQGVVYPLALFLKALGRRADPGLGIGHWRI